MWTEQCILIHGIKCLTFFLFLSCANVHLCLISQTNNYQFQIWAVETEECRTADVFLPTDLLLYASCRVNTCASWRHVGCCVVLAHAVNGCSRVTYCHNLLFHLWRPTSKVMQPVNANCSGGKYDKFLFHIVISVRICVVLTSKFRY